MNGLPKHCCCLSDNPPWCCEFAWENKVGVMSWRSLAGALLRGLWTGAAPAGRPARRAPAVQTALVRLTRHLGIIRDTDESHRHLDRAPWELKSEKAISLCGRFSKHLEADIFLDQGPVSLTSLLQTPSLFGSYIWCSYMWHNNNTFRGKKASADANSSKPNLWENCVGFSFHHYK